MKFAVCAHYDGTTILMDVFDSKEDAQKYIETPQYVNFNDGERYTIYIDEMWVEPYEDIPFCEPIKIDEYVTALANDDLPF